MTAIMATGHGQGWRVAGWGLLATLLALPAVAMQFTTEVSWTALDFIMMGIMLGVLGVGFELLIRFSTNWWHGVGMAVGLVTAFLLIWVNLAVGIIGSERNDANFLFAGVLAVAVGGASIARLRSMDLARAMLATAVAHTLVAGIALAGGLGVDGPAWPWDLIGTTVMFDGMWLFSALLFHRAAR